METCTLILFFLSTNTFYMLTPSDRIALIGAIGVEFSSVGVEGSVPVSGQNSSLAAI